MGYYTKLRGYFEIADDSFEAAEKRMAALKCYMEEAPGYQRAAQITNYLILMQGHGSLWIFVGTEFKHYDKEIDLLLKAMRKFFPEAEGRLDIQTESQSPPYPGDDPTQWECSHKTIQYNKFGYSEVYEPTWCVFGSSRSLEDVHQIVRPSTPANIEPPGES